MLLYGFPSQEELDLFRMLIGVSGVGPKGAMGILSVLTPEDLRSAVLTEDAQAISKAPGIGKKTAQKVILELRDRMDLMDSFAADSMTPDPDLSNDASPASEAVLALTALGYARADAARAVRAATEGQVEMDVEMILKAALKRL